jgi:membrane associated rhomboid family serine protease
MQISITLIIIVVTVLVSIGGFSNQKIINDLIFYPPSVRQGQWWRMFSCGFIHADFGHLLFNMYALYIFGIGSQRSGVEYSFIDKFGEKGIWIYLVMYLSALAVCLLPTYARHKNDYNYRSLGASGAVSAVVFAQILFDPLRGLGLFFIPVFISGFLFGIIYLLVSQWLDRKGGSNINHSAHIWGALFGIAFTILACRFFSDFPVLSYFIDQIRNMDPSQIIQTGRY